MSLFWRGLALGFALGGIVLLSGMLILYGLLPLVFVRVICLLVSIGVGIGLLWLIRFTTKWAVVKNKEAGRWTIHLAVLVPLTLAVIFVLFVLTVFDWGPGTSIRSLFNLQSLLPSGNLLVTGGKVGWIYLGLVILLIVAATIGRHRGNARPPSEKPHLFGKRGSKSHPSEAQTSWSISSTDEEAEDDKRFHDTFSALGLNSES